MKSTASAQSLMGDLEGEAPRLLTELDPAGRVDYLCSKVEQIYWRTDDREVARLDARLHALCLVLKVRKVRIDELA